MSMLWERNRRWSHDLDSPTDDDPGADRGAGGDLDWEQWSRAFYGFRARVPLGDGDLGLLDALYLLEAENEHKDDNLRSVYGAYLSNAPSALDTLDLYLMRVGKTYSANHDRNTFGAHLGGRQGAVTYGAEAALQTGSEQTVPVRAHMLAVRLGTHALGDRAHVSLWYDRLSGNDQQGRFHTLTSFETPYATTHEYLGLADVFSADEQLGPRWHGL